MSIIKESIGSKLGRTYGDMASDGQLTVTIRRDDRRYFRESEKNDTLSRQDNKCLYCSKELNITSKEFDHLIPWTYGGNTCAINCIALCPKCHSRKTNDDRFRVVEL
jgi:5-methylcytosine-specific restriction endonuclease McrA